MSQRVRITLDITAEAGTEWDKVLDAAARAAADATTGECVILVEGRSIPYHRQCRRHKVRS